MCSIETRKSETLDLAAEEKRVEAQITEIIVRKMRMLAEQRARTKVEKMTLCCVLMAKTHQKFNLVFAYSLVVLAYTLVVSAYTIVVPAYTLVVSAYTRHDSPQASASLQEEEFVGGG